MTRDDIMHLVNETAPRYQSWGCEAHFQLFATRLLEIEREACAQVCERVSEDVTYQRDSQEAADKCAAAIRARRNT
jgi:hypothetical protein